MINCVFLHMMPAYSDRCKVVLGFGQCKKVSKLCVNFFPSIHRSTDISQCQKHLSFVDDDFMTVYLICTQTTDKIINIYTKNSSMPQNRADQRTK